MTLANEITGGVALCLMCLACKGYLRHLDLWGRDAVALMMQGIVIGSAVIALRIASYDIVIPVLRYYDVLAGPPMRPLTEWMNTGFNAVFGIAAWRFLKALHATIPADERDGWYWWNCAFYPNRFRALWRNWP